jgi:hypothetical protein
VRNCCSILLSMVALLTSVIAQADIIDGENLVDPTRPLFASNRPADEVNLTELYRTVVPASFEISFIRAGDTNPVAVINNLQVTLGDVIGGATVSSIGRDSVTLLINGEERIISLYNTSVKSAVIPR